MLIHMPFRVEFAKAPARMDRATIAVR